MGQVVVRFLCACCGVCSRVPVGDQQQGVWGSDTIAWGGWA